MRKVIVNSTPIIALCKCDHLSVLKDMYGNITIPQAVFDEVTKKNDTVREQIMTSPWIDIEVVSNDLHRKMYSSKLHAGEVEVMILAEEAETEHLVIIDDEAARRTASFLGLNMTGTIGVLIKAKEKGLVQSVLPILKEMKTNGIYISDRLTDQVKKLTKE